MAFPRLYSISLGLFAIFYNGNWPLPMRSLQITAALSWSELWVPRKEMSLFFSHWIIDIYIHTYTNINRYTMVHDSLIYIKLLNNELSCFADGLREPKLSQGLIANSTRYQYFGVWPGAQPTHVMQSTHVMFPPRSCCCTSECLAHAELSFDQSFPHPMGNCNNETDFTPRQPTCTRTTTRTSTRVMTVKAAPWQVTVKAPPAHPIPPDLVDCAAETMGSSATPWY